jgi:hypothetical protein
MPDLAPPEVRFADPSLRNYPGRPVYAAAIEPLYEEIAGKVWWEEEAENVPEISQVAPGLRDSYGYICLYRLSY